MKRSPRRRRRTKKRRTKTKRTSRRRGRRSEMILNSGEETRKLASGRLADWPLDAVLMNIQASVQTQASVSEGNLAVQVAN